jgi:integrase
MAAHPPRTMQGGTTLATTYDVRIYSLRTHTSKRGVDTFNLRWNVAGKTFCKTFKTKGLAESHRAELITAQRAGTPFDVAEGLPITILRNRRDSITWYQHAMDFIDMKWSTLEGGSRRTYAESLATVTAAMVHTKRGIPEPTVLFRALAYWAFNTSARRAGPPPAEYRLAIAWIEKNSLPVTALADSGNARLAFNATTISHNGKQFAAKTARNKRQVLVGGINYAIELGLLENNPLSRLAVTVKRKQAAVDRRVVVNPTQAVALLQAVGRHGESGKRLVAFFATIYYAGLRPSEAMALRREDCILPATGWGQLRFAEASPYTGKAWTDTKESHPRKALKHREEDEGRIVPVHPTLVAHLREHLETYGTTADGRIFRNSNNNPMTYASYGQVWRKAREETLTTAQVRSPLGKRPYDLRHACLSTWLNAGVPATQVAEWAGHSVAMLLSTYAKCLDGQENAAMMKIESALELVAAPENFHGPQEPGT